jgi:hypothetical protein
MKRIDIFVSCPEDVQKERSLVERTMRAVAAEFGVPITVTYSNWLRQHNPLDSIAAHSANGSDDDRMWLCPCIWEYRDSDLDQNYHEQIPNTGSYDLVISILWSRLGTKVSPAFVMPDGSQPGTANEYEIGWVLDQLDRTPGFPELRVYRNRAAPPAPLLLKAQRDAFFRDWDGVQEFFAGWEKKQGFTDACSDYSDLEEFESLFRAHFRDFLGRQLEKEIVPRKQPRMARYWKSEPFRGLRFFDFEHAPIFHGRTKAVGEVLDALDKQVMAKTPFVLVLGASGSGKSSLVRAGVLPLLTEVGTITGKGPWRYAITRPGAEGDPLDALAAALLADTALPELRKTRTREDWSELAAALRGDPEKVAFQIKELLDRISAQELDHLLNRKEDQTPVHGRIESTELVRHRKLRRGKPKAQVALFIDQLEDLFTSGFTLDLQHQYFAAIAALVRCQRVHVIAALGSDYYASYQQFPELVDLTKPSGRFDLQAPTRAELGKMIRAPAEASGLSFERQAKTGQGLDDALLDAAVGLPDKLPLLEHLLFMLYRKQRERADGSIRWSDYAELGEFEGALAHHAQEVFTKLSSDGRQAFDFVMRRLAPVELDEKAFSRTALYRELVSSPEQENRLRAGAKELVDGMVQEGLFTSETDCRQQVVISVAHAALFRKWPRFRDWVVEDQEFLRMRDRVEGCLKSWLKRGRQTHDLLSPGASLTDGETLLDHFRSSLSNAQIEYIQKSLAQQKRGRWIGNTLWLPVVALLSLAAFVGVRWLNDQSQRSSTQEFSRVERRLAELVKTDRGGNQTEVKEAEEKAQLARRDAELSAAQLSAMEAQLQKAQELAKQNADLAVTQQSALEAQLKQAQDKLQSAQRDAELASTQRAASETQLKQTQETLQQAQQNAEAASNERAALESQLKQAGEKLKQAQQNADLASGQRADLESQLKQAQQNVDLTTSQRVELESQLKQAQDKLKQAGDELKQTQQNVDLVSSQRADLESQLKQAQDKLKQTQQNVDLVSSQRADLESQLKQAQDKLKQTQQNADLASTQRAAMESQLKEAEDKFQQVQQNADPTSKQRVALEAQLKQAQDKLEEARQNAELTSGQRAAVETQLKQTQDKLQQAQQNGDVAASQRAALETQLKQAQDKQQQAQQTADAAASQRAGFETQLKQAQDKLEQAQQTADAAVNQRTGLEAQLKQAEDRLRQAQQNADLGASQRVALEARLKRVEDNLQLTQQRADLATSARAALEAQLRDAEEKVQLAQKIAELVAAQAHPADDGPAKGEAARKNRDTGNQPRSGRALPLDGGQNPEPGTSIQPAQPGNH